MEWHKLIEHIAKSKALTLPFMFFIGSAFAPVLFVLVRFLAAQNRMYKERLPKIKLNDVERKELALFYNLLPNDMLEEYSTVVKRDTLQRWFSKFWKVKSDFSDRREQKTKGRKRKTQLVRDLVIRLAIENPTWGYKTISNTASRIYGAICATTVAETLKAAGIPPSKERKRSWQLLHDLKNSSIWSCDFMKQEVATDFGVYTYYVMVFIHIGSRKIALSTPTLSPTHEWVLQQAKNQVHISDWMEDAEFFIRDNDVLYPDERYHPHLTKEQTFDGIIESGTGIKVLHTAYQAPKMNAYCERVIRTIREGAGLSKKEPTWGYDNFLLRLREFQKYYNHERHHQGRNDNAIPCPDKNADTKVGKIEKRTRLGNLNYYFRQAA